VALTFEKVFGRKKSDGPDTSAGPLLLKKFERVGSYQERDAGGLIPTEETRTMSDKKYIVSIDGFTEKGARHMKGDELKIAIDEDRAQALIKAGYITEKTEDKPVEKVIEAPQQKIITGEDTEKKGATGKGLDLLKGKKKK
jgi:hypothetical protein